jgi:hypothetical protein
MLSTLDNRQDDRRDVLEISPDVVLVARAAADFPTLAPGATGREAHMDVNAEMPGEYPRVDTTFRASDTSGERSSHGKWLRRAATVFAFAFVSVLATAAWERYGDELQAMLANSTPQFSLASLVPTSLFSGRAAVAAPPNDTPAPQAVAADQAPQSAAADAAAPSAAVSSDTAQLLQSMARDVATLNQQLSELKASIAQLKAGQDQLSRDMAKVPEPKVSEAKPVEPHPAAPAKLGAPPRPLGTLVTPVHRPRPPSPPYPPAQAAYVPPPPPAAAPVQIAPQATTEPDGSTVVRPPMPVR